MNESDGKKHYPSCHSLLLHDFIAFSATTVVLGWHHCRPVAQRQFQYRQKRSDDDSLAWWFFVVYSLFYYCLSLLKFDHLPAYRSERDDVSLSTGGTLHWQWLAIAFFCAPFLQRILCEAIPMNGMVIEGLNAAIKYIHKCCQETRTRLDAGLARAQHAQPD